MSDIGRVVVLAGGLSHEREVSLRSGRRVTEALRGVGVEVEILDADASLLSSLKEDPPAVVFPTLHGEAGEDGAVRAVLELLRLPYVGAQPASCRVAFDKPTAKDEVARAGVATPGSVALPRSTFRDLGANSVIEAIVDRLGLPLFVKPARGGSALGATVVRTAAELPHAMVGCFAYGETALVERFVAGTEVAVSVVDTGVGPIALPVVEIVPDGGVYDYAARYTAGRAEFFTPARLSEAETEAVTRTAITAHRSLGLRDISRTDLILDTAGTPWFLEVNVAPGLTETSLMPQAVVAGRGDLGTLCHSLLQAALARA